MAAVGELLVIVTSSYSTQPFLIIVQRNMLISLLRLVIVVIFIEASAKEVGPEIVVQRPYPGVGSIALKLATSVQRIWSSPASAVNALFAITTSS